MDNPIIVNKIFELLKSPPIEFGADGLPVALFPVQGDQNGLRWNHINTVLEFLKTADELISDGLNVMSHDFNSVYPAVCELSRKAYEVFWAAYWLDTRDRNSYTQISQCFKTEFFFTLSYVPRYCRGIPNE